MKKLFTLLAVLTAVFLIAPPEASAEVWKIKGTGTSAACGNWTEQNMGEFNGIFYYEIPANASTFEFVLVRNEGNSNDFYGWNSGRGTNSAEFSRDTNAYMTSWGTSGCNWKVPVQNGHTYYVKVSHDGDGYVLRVEEKASSIEGYALHGSFTSSAWTNAFLTQDGSKWKGTVRVTQADGYFGVSEIRNGVQSGWISGLAGWQEVKAPTNASPVTSLSLGSSNNENIKIYRGTYDVEFTPSTGAMTLTPCVFLLTDIDGWDLTTGAKASAVNNVYTFTDVSLQPNKYYKFATVLGANSGDWGTVNAGAYGPNGGKDFNINSGSYNDTGLTQCEGSYKYDGSTAKTATMVLNLSAKTLSVTGPSDATPTVTVTENGAGTYTSKTLEVKLSVSNAPNAKYKINNGAAQTLSDGENTIPIGDQTFSIAESQTITLSYSADGTTYTDLSYTLNTPFIYILGELNNWIVPMVGNATAYNNWRVFEGSTKGVYTRTFESVAANAAQFRFFTELYNTTNVNTAWGNANYLGLASDTNVDFTDNVYNGSYQEGKSNNGNWNFYKWKTSGKLSVEVNTNDKTVKFTRVEGGTPAPSATISDLANMNYLQNQAEVTITPSNVDSWWYAIDGGAHVDKTGTTPVTITLGNAATTSDRTYTVTVGTGDEVLATREFNFTYNAPLSVTAVNLWKSATEKTALAYNSVLKQWELPYFEDFTAGSDKFRIEVVYSGGDPAYFTDGRGTTNATYWLGGGDFTLAQAEGGYFVFAGNDNNVFKSNNFVDKAASIVVKGFTTGVHQPQPTQMVLTVIDKVALPSITFKVGDATVSGDNVDYTTNTLGVKVEVSGHTGDVTYKINDANPQTLALSDGEATVTLGGAPIVVTRSYTLTVEAVNSIGGKTTKATTFRLKYYNADSAPATMYLRGSDNWGEPGIEMTKTGNVFTGQITLPDNGEVKFKDCNSIEYGASDNAGNVNASTATTYPVHGDHGYCWVLSDAGTYAVTFDYATHSVRFDKVRNLYVRIDPDGSWGSSGIHQMNKVEGEDRYEVTITAPGETVYFVLANKGGDSIGDITDNADCQYWSNDMTKVNGDIKTTLGETNAVYIWNDATYKAMFVSGLVEGNNYKFVMDFGARNDDGANFSIMGDNTITGLNFPVKQYRDFGKWDRNALFVKVENANNNEFRPDWEMTYIGKVDDKDTWSLPNVTFHKNPRIEAVEVSPEYVMVGNTVVHHLADIKDSENKSIESNIFGKVYNLTYTHEDGLTIEKVSDVPQFVGLVGFPFQQFDQGDTPILYSGNDKYETNNYRGNTSFGWQESWIVYEDNFPMKVNDYYVYSSQWPPLTPISFKEVYSKKENGEETAHFEREISSINMTFTRYAQGAKTGAELSEILGGHEYDKLFAARGGDDVADDDSDGDTRLDPAKTYVRYTARDLWVMGAVKMWTGWQTKSFVSGSETMADWGDYANWGKFGGGQTDNEKGDLIGTGVPFKMEKDKGNIIFDKPTYFKTIEFFVELKKDGTPSDNAVIFTVMAEYSAEIDAVAAKSDPSSTVLDSGSYKLGIDKNSFGAGVKMRSYNVKRYVADANMQYDYDEWTPAYSLTRPEGHADENVVAHAEATVDDNGVVTDDSAVLAAFPTPEAWVVEDQLRNGRYVYVLTVELDIPTGEGTYTTKTIQVQSATFSIANFDQKAYTRPMQLLQLTTAGKEKLKSEVLDLKSIDNANLRHMTFVEAGAGYYYAIVSYPRIEGNWNGIVDDYAYEVPSHVAREIIKDNDNYRWTSRYFVTGFDGAAYDNEMSKAKANHAIEDYTEPTVTIAWIKEQGSTITMTSKPTVRSNNGQYGTVFEDAAIKGDLSQKYFKTQLKYFYKPTGALQSTEKNDSHEGTTKPQIARPYGSHYTYTYHPTTADNMQEVSGKEWLKMKVTSPSKMAKNADNPKFNPYAAENMNEVYVKASDIHPRVIDCNFYFSRPNLCEELLKNYQIRYEIAINSDFDQTDDNSILAPTEYVDTDDVYGSGYDSMAPPSGDTYKVTVTEVHPFAKFYPIFKITKTTYVRVDADGNPIEDRKLVANFGTPEKTVGSKTYDVYVEGVNHAYREKNASLDSLYFRNLKPGYTDGMTGRKNNSSKNMWMYAGHAELRDAGDVIHDPSLSLKDKTEKVLELDAKFFHIELEDTENNELVTYPYLAQHKCDDPEENTGAMNAGTRWLKVGNGDPLVGTYLGDLTTDKLENVVAHFSPVYIFYRSAAGMHVDNSSDYTTIHPRTAKMAPQRTAEYGDDGKGNPITVTQTMPDYDATLPSADKVKDLDADDGLQVLTGGEFAKTPTLAKNQSTTGIESVDANGQDGEVEYFNLQGIRVENPTPGVYLMRSGSTVEKVIVK